MSGRTGKEVKQSERRGQLALFAIVGKLVFWLLIIGVFMALAYMVFGQTFSNLSWLFDIDPMIFFVLMGLGGLFVAFIFMRAIGGGRGKK